MNAEPVDLRRLKLEIATASHASEICNLINLTYRGKSGWTTENHIVQGNRTNRQEIEIAINNPNAYFFIANQKQKLACCIYIEKQEHSAYIGFFSVHPSLQGKGIGNYLLNEAEKFALTKFGAKKYSMFVISQRTELIAFYQRRGYRRTGRVKPYPKHLNMGTPRIAGLTIEYLEKTCSFGN